MKQSFLWAFGLTLILGAMSALCQAPPVHAAQTPAPISSTKGEVPAPPEPERWDWSESVLPGQGIRVENPFGDVRARFGGYEGKVEIHAVLQNLHAGAAPLKVLTDFGPAGLTIRVGRPAGAEPPAGDGPKDHVDLVVRIPKGSPLTLRTISGTIEANGLQGDVSAESERGSISVRDVRGLVSTVNRYGVTELVLEAPPPGSEQTFESLTGDISVTLPARADATVVAQTSAWITTDISLDIVRHPREEPSKTATGKVGNGTARLLFKTKRGSIQIFQMDDVSQLEIAPHTQKTKPPGSDDD